MSKAPKSFMKSHSRTQPPGRYSLLLTQQLKGSFDSTLRSRGEYYFEHNHVGKHTLHPDAVSFEIVGTETYTTEFIIGTDKASLALSCNCPASDNGKHFCKHIWACIRAFDERKLYQHFELKNQVTAYNKVDFLAKVEATPQENAPLWRVATDHLVRASTSGKTEYQGAPIEVVLRFDPLQSGNKILLEVVAHRLNSIATIPLQYRDLNSITDPLLKQLLQEYFLIVSESTPFMGQGLRTLEITQATLPIFIQALTNNAITTTKGEPLTLNQEKLWGIHFVAAINETKGDSSSQVTATIEPYFVRGQEKRTFKGLKHFADSALAFDKGEFQLFSPHITATVLNQVKNAFPLTVNESDIPEFVRQFRTTLTFPLHVPEKYNWPTEILTPKPVIHLQSAGLNRTHGQLAFMYNDHIYHPNDGKQIPLQADAQTLHSRNLNEEAEIIKALETQLKSQAFGGMGRGEFLLGSKDLSPSIHYFSHHGYQVFYNEQKIHANLEISSELSSSLDWFDLKLLTSFNKHQVHFPDLLKALKESSFIKLANGEMGFVSDDWRSKLELLAEFGQSTKEGLRLTPLQALILQNAQTIVPIDSEMLKQRWKQLIVEKTDPPSDRFKGTLRPYQERGLGWIDNLSEIRVGGILADDMGLGKTVQMLSYIDRFHPKKSLIVVPKSLTYNWLDEAQRFVPHLSFFVYSAETRKKVSELYKEHDVIIVSHHLLRRDFKEFADVDYDLTVLDEAQVIKNPKAQISQAMKALRSKHRYALTGTPVENSIQDLYSIMDFVNPGLLSNKTKSGTNDSEKLTLLSRGLAPFILRRTKDQVLTDLPEKTEQILWCELSDSEQAQYDELRAYYQNHLTEKISEGGLGRSKMIVLEALLRLRQAACHQGLLNKDAKTSSKVQLLLEMLEELIAEGHKVLVFSQFTSFLKLITPELEEKGIKYSYLDGQTKDRAEVVRGFQDGTGGNVFMLSLKAGGVGLNLTAADYVFLMDPWWNPAVETQAIDRTHRIGQKNRVMAYRIIVKGSIEEKVLDLQKKKRHLKDLVLADDESLLKSLTEDDLKALLG